MPMSGNETGKERITWTENTEIVKSGCATFQPRILNIFSSLPLKWPKIKTIHWVHSVHQFLWPWLPSLWPGTTKCHKVHSVHKSWCDHGCLPSMPGTLWPILSVIKYILYTNLDGHGCPITRHTVANTKCHKVHSVHKSWWQGCLLCNLHTVADTKCQCHRVHSVHKSWCDQSPTP